MARKRVATYKDAIAAERVIGEGHRGKMYATGIKTKPTPYNELTGVNAEMDDRLIGNIANKLLSKIDALIDDTQEELLNDNFGYDEIKKIMKRVRSNIAANIRSR